MADNTHPSDDALIATEESAGVHFQKMELISKRVRQTSVLVTAGGITYDDKQAIGAAIELANFARAPFRSGVIEQVTVALDDPVTNTYLKVFFFNAAPTVAGDGVAFEPTFAQMDGYLGSASLGQPVLRGANRQWWDSVTNWTDNHLEIPYVTAGTSIWAVVTANALFSGAIAGANKWKLSVMARLD